MGSSNNSYDDSMLVRVRYSTIINYIGQLYRLLAAVGFALIVTRRLSVAEYGLFTTIIGLTGIITSVYGIWNFWVPRFYARKRYDLVSTAFLLDITYAPIGYTIIVLLGLYYASVLNQDLLYFLVGGLIIFISLINGYNRSIVIGSRPFIEGKIIVLRETLRIIFVYTFIILLYLRVLGAILGIVLTLAFTAILYILYMRYYGLEIPRPLFRKEKIAILVKNSYISLIFSLYTFLSQIERPFLTLITASTVVAAYLGVSYIPRSIILQSGRAFTSGLAARLLRKPVREDIEDVLRICFIINIGLLFITISLNRTILSLFRKEYIDAWPLFILFTIESLIMIVSNIFSAIATALERKDLYESGRALLDTPLFKLYMARFIRGTISIATASIVAAIMLYLGVSNPILICLPYPLFWLISSIPYMIYAYKEARKKIYFAIPWRELFSSTISGLTTAIALHIIGGTDFIVASFWSDIFVLLKIIIIAFTIYSIIVLALSPWLRAFIKKSISYYFMK